MSPTSELLANTLAHPDFHPRLAQQRRLYEAAKAAIHQQRLGAGKKLPSSRDLARDLGIARNTVIAAFEQLAAEGYVRSAQGSGTYVSNLMKMASTKPVAASPSLDILLSRRGAQICANPAASRFEIQPFAPGAADFSAFPFKLWQRLQNRVWREGRSDLLDTGNSGGYLPLRHAITDYLRMSRSVKVSVGQVLITAGTQHALDLCAQLLADPGDLAWVEDPGYWGARLALRSNELSLRAIAVDADGAKPSEADIATHPRLIYLTPSHQYPTGAVMSLARRRELLDIAARKQAWILEDDYDSEFRYTGRPLASLQGLDTNNRVLYMGTFSKVLYPGIKVGYLVVPEVLAQPFKNALYDLQRPGQLMVQAALADFIQAGHFTAHLRKLRQIFGARREMLRRTLAAPLLERGIAISSEESGLHLVVELPADADDVALERRAAASGIQVRALSTYFLASPTRKGLLVGYAYVTPENILRYGHALAQLIAQVVPSTGTKWRS
jgi:GntR family transcriptional regulator/MocR family aminotransferase